MHNSRKQYSIFLTFVLCLIFTFPISSQTLVERIVQSQVDSSDSQYDQAMAIYNWVTSNIKYDAKAFKEYDFTRHDPDQIIRRKRGLCGDYAALVNSMCKASGIESYAISGYSKGFGYLKGQAFLRADHAWNIIRVDSSWIHVDATWGSGSLVSKPGVFPGLISRLTGSQAKHNRLVFKKNQDLNYFDIPTDQLVATHYPLDPSWLKSNHPYKFSSFESGTDSLTLSYVNFYSELQKNRFRLVEYQLYDEGLKAHEYNDHNYFDLAQGYVVKADMFNSEREVSELNNDGFEQTKKEYTIALESIVQHKALLDSIYKLRFAELRQLNSDQKRLMGKVKSRIKSARKTFKPEEKKHRSKRKSLLNRMYRFEEKARRASEKELKYKPWNPTSIQPEDRISGLRTRLFDLEKEQQLKHLELDSMGRNLQELISQDARVNDSLLNGNRSFHHDLSALNAIMHLRNEELISHAVDSLKLAIQSIDQGFSRKRTIKSQIQQNTSTFNRGVNDLVKLIREEKAILKELAQYNGYGGAAIQVHDSTVISEIEAYKKGKVFNDKLYVHEAFQVEFKRSNLKQLKSQKKLTRRFHRVFTAWYESVYSREKEKYASEKKINGEIRSHAMKKLGRIDLKLKKFNQNKEKVQEN